MTSQLQERILKGSIAKLFPVLPESKKEERATSILLSVLTIVPDLANIILSDCGVKVSQRTSIAAYTEVSLKGEYSNLRPDGLLIVHNKNKTWSALIESKVGNAKYSDEQIENYLNIAKEQNIDAVITLSNQYTASPLIHPSYNKKAKYKNIALYHFSWASINASSILLIENKSVNDTEQAFILHELTRFLSHDSSGVSSSISPPKSWKQLCDDVFHGVPVRKSAIDTEECVATWFQLLRYTTINLSLALSRSCTVSLTRKHLADNSTRIQDSISLMTSKSILFGAIEIPDTASNLDVELDFNKRTLKFSGKIQTPKDVKQTRAAVNFVLNQLKNIEDESLFVKFNWPGRINSTQGAVVEFLDEEKRPNLVPDNFKGLPVSAEVIRIIDLGAGIKSSKKLNEIFDTEVINFYKNSLQILKNWQPKAPKVKTIKVSESNDISDSTANATNDGLVRNWPFKLSIFDNS